MSELPVASSPTLPVATLDPADAAVDRFLARVAALTPTQWGELDAASQRLFGGDPITRWRRARYYSAAAAPPPVIHDVLTVIGVGGELVLDTLYAAARVVDALGGDRRVTRWLTGPSDPDVARRRVTWPPGTERVRRALRELDELVAAAPGGRSSVLAQWPLSQALLAVSLRPKISEAAFAAMYRLVEPVIPAASLA